VFSSAGIDGSTFLVQYSGLSVAEPPFDALHGATRFILSPHVLV